MNYVLSRLAFHVEKDQTANGAEFPSEVRWRLLDQGIGHVHIRPVTPRLNWEVGRSHRIDAEELNRLLEGIVMDTGLFTEKLQEWKDYDKYQRPHGDVGHRAPCERLLRRPKTQVITSHRQVKWKGKPHSGSRSWKQCDRESSTASADWD